MSRRLMYWQAYLHKTSLVAELILMKILKKINIKGIPLPCSEPYCFLAKQSNHRYFGAETLDLFAQLDDFDIIRALKSWQTDDFILSSLSKMIVNRDLLKIKLTSEKSGKLQQKSVALENNISIETETII
jgi:HD superfamily phosphohydrolase